VVDSQYNTTTLKMLKTGFRGERKGILTPSLSQGEGECGDGESEGDVVKTSRWLPLKGECSDGKDEGDEEGMWRRFQLY